MLGIRRQWKHSEVDDSVEVIWARLSLSSNDSVDLVIGILYLKLNSQIVVMRERVGHDHVSAVSKGIQFKSFEN